MGILRFLSESKLDFREGERQKSKKILFPKGTLTEGMEINEFISTKKELKVRKALKARTISKLN